MSSTYVELIKELQLYKLYWNVSIVKCVDIYIG